MFRPFKRTLTPAAVPDVISSENYDQDHFAAGVTGASWALTNTSTTDGLAHQVSITNNTATDHSAKTVTISGTDDNGQAISETGINLPGSNLTVKTTLFFKTIETPLVPSATIGADTMDIGISAEFASVAYPSGTYYGNLNIGIEITDTVNYGIDHTFSDVQVEPSTDWNWLNNANDNITDSTTIDFVTIRPKAIRFRANSYDTGAIINLIIQQSYN